MAKSYPMTAEDRLRLWHPRGTLCAVCRRPTRGFGWFDPRAAAPPRPSVWFCSMACQGFWTRLARERWAMVDLTEQEKAAIRAAMKPIAEIMEEIGWQTRLVRSLRGAGADADRGRRRRLPGRHARHGRRSPPMRRSRSDAGLQPPPHHAPSASTRLIDAALAAERAATPPRTYLGGSRLGHACERALQFEFAGAAKDDGAEFGGQTLRIFAIGHALEDLAIRWLRARRASISIPARATVRMASSSASPSLAVASAAMSTGSSLRPPAALGLRAPALWECKTMNAKNWRERQAKGVVVAKPVYAAQIALYQAYMEAQVPGISDNPALFTAINKDTAELHHELVPFDAGLAQRMSDRAVRILQAMDVGDLLPRIATRDP